MSLDVCEYGISPILFGRPFPTKQEVNAFLQEEENASRDWIQHSLADAMLHKTWWESADSAIFMHNTNKLQCATVRLLRILDTIVDDKSAAKEQIAQERSIIEELLYCYRGKV